MPLPIENSDEQRRLKIKEGELIEDIYDKEALEQLEEDDEIEPWEQGFIQGTLNHHLAKDALTGKPIINADQAYELRLGGDLYWFENEHNAQEYLKRKRSVQR